MTEQTDSITSNVDRQRITALAQSVVRIPSPRWEETALAEYLATYLFGLGFDVALPALERLNYRTKQVVATLQAGSGPTLLLHAHMDTGSGQYQGLVFKPERWTRDPLGGLVEDGWLYGLGTQNNKNGVVTCCMAAEALVRSDVRLNGTLKLVFVAAHSPGGVGITQLLRDGLTADAAVVAEGTGQDIVTIESGVFRGTITVRGGYAHHDKYVDAIAQAYKVIEAFGPPYQPQDAGGAWLTFTPYPKLPGYPRAAIRKIESELDSCTLLFDILAVPSMTNDSVAADINRMLDRLSKSDQSFKAEVGFNRWMGPYSENNFYGALEQPEDSPIVLSFLTAHQQIMGVKPRVGLGSRDAAASDAQILRRHGIPAIQYGPGSLKDLSGVWPAVDERIRIADIESCVKAMAVGVGNFLS